MEAGHVTRIEGDDIWPIPLAARRGLLHPAFAWSGFSSAFASIVFGHRLQMELGTPDALLACVLGSWLLFIYSAAIGYAGGRWGLNSQLMLQAVFGRVGAILPGVVLAGLVAGWFGFHVSLTATMLAEALGRPGSAVPWSFAVGALFAAPVLLGFSRGFNLTAISLPAMLVFSALVLARWIVPGWTTLLDGPLTGTLSFGTGVCIAFGMFVVSGTMTGDIVRYCRTGNEAVQVMAVGFLASNMPFLILGVLIGAADLDPLQLLAAGTPLSLLLLSLVFLSQWITCDACLANASVTLKSAFPALPWPLLVAGAALAGIVIGLSGALDDVFAWATFLTAVVTPIGGIIVADYYVLRVQVGFSRARAVDTNLAALAALALSVSVTLAVWFFMLGALSPLLGAPLGGLLYLALAGIAPRELGAGLGRDTLGAEAVE